LLLLTVGGFIWISFDRVLWINMWSHCRLIVGLLWAKTAFKISLNELMYESKWSKRKEKKRREEKRKRKRKKEKGKRKKERKNWEMKSNFLIFFDFDNKLPICKFESLLGTHTKLWNVVSCMRIRSLSDNLFFAVHVIAEKWRLEISKFGREQNRKEKR